MERETATEIEPRKHGDTGRVYFTNGKSPGKSGEKEFFREVNNFLELLVSVCEAKGPSIPKQSNFYIYWCENLRSHLEKEDFFIFG